MKSAYELAMERLNQASGPTRKLSVAQKAQIAEIDKRYDAKAAELKLTSESAMRAATSAEELENAQAALVSGLADVEARREQEKADVWNALPPHSRK